MAADLIADRLLPDAVQSTAQWIRIHWWLPDFESGVGSTRSIWLTVSLLKL